MIINLGDAPFKAFIKVTYPNGTCTVSLGGKSFTHTGGGTHTFTVNKKGTWTVMATNTAGVVETQTVNITTRGQTVSVTLVCRLYFYNRGDMCGANSGGWGRNDEGGVLFNSDHMELTGKEAYHVFAHSYAPVPVEYKNMVIVGEVTKQIGNVCFQNSGLCNNNWDVTGAYWNYDVVGAFTQTVDISNITSPYDRYVKIVVGLSGWCIGKIYEVYFE